MKRVLWILIICFVIQAVINNSLTTLADSKSGDIAIKNTVRSMKAKYVTSDKSAISLKWAPATDPNMATNKTYCRYKKGAKVEKLGALSCVNLSTIKYSINKGNVKMNLLYSTLTGGLSEFYIETTNQTPARKYLYRVNYPNADLMMTSIIFNKDSAMSFDKSGKLDVYVVDNKNSCKTEDSKGEIVDSMYARSLCLKRALNQFK